MARKINKRFRAELSLNKEKAGAWLATVTLHKLYTDDAGSPMELLEVASVTAWKNASAAKRWVKLNVQEKTPRKNVKLIAGTDTNDKGKPASFRGSLDFRVEA